MILVTIASVPTSSEGMTEFRPAHLALLKQKCLLTLTVGKKFMLLKVNKQALYWKFKTQTNQVSRQVNGVLSIYLLYLLTFSISGLLEMWLCLLTLYFRSQKSSQKIFLDRAALIRRLPVNGLKQ